MPLGRGEKRPWKGVEEHRNAVPKKEAFLFDSARVCRNTGAFGTNPRDFVDLIRTAVDVPSEEIRTLHKKKKIHTSKYETSAIDMYLRKGGRG